MDSPHRSCLRLRLRLARLALLAGAVLAVAALAVPAGGTSEPGAPLGGIDVVSVEGLIDPANATLVKRSISEAEERGSTLLVFQVDSGGAVGVDVDELVRAVRESEVPIAVWVGPPGAFAKGGAATLATAAPVLGVARGARIGPALPVSLDEPGKDGPSAVIQEVSRLQEASGRDTESAGVLVQAGLSSQGALERGAIDSDASVVGDLIVSLDGKTVVTAAGPVELSTAEVIGEGEDRRRRPNQPVRFSKLDLGGQISHTLTTPWVAYLLLVAGGALIVFEFFTIGIGVAGAVGAVAIAGSAAGLTHLPVQWWALALIVVGVLGFAVDLQAGGLGAWTAIGATALVTGSFTLFGGSSRLDPAWWVVALVCGGYAAFMAWGMTGVLRSRFSTPTVGREGIVGEEGSVEVDVAPEGVVRIRGALWRAQTRRSTPIRTGDGVRVVAVEGLILEVEPAE